MAKGKDSTPNLFGDFNAPARKPAREPEPVKEDVKEEKPVKAVKPKKDTKKTEAEIAASLSKARGSKAEGKKPGRPKAENPRTLKYLDVSGVESYITIRAKQEGMYMAEYLRWLVMKDGTEHPEVFSLLVDMKDERVVKDMEKFGISV